MYLYDLVDEHLNICLEKDKPKLKKFMETEIYAADKVIAVSYTLKEQVDKNYNVKSLPVFNGADLEKFRSISLMQNQKIIKKYNLDGCKIIGYVGNFGEWSGIEFIIEVFKEISDSNIKLLLIGPGKIVDELIPEDIPNIIKTGGVKPDEIPEFLSIMDIGIVPVKKCGFTDNSFRIKMIEYGAARLPVISTPIEEMMKHNLDYVYFSENKNDWIDFILKFSKNDWKKEWDLIVEKYTWKNILRSMGLD
jgi:teichuronic acid biosynthesis glycosyltransferase TuaH